MLMSIGKLVDFIEYYAQHVEYSSASITTLQGGEIQLLVRDHGWIYVTISNAGVRCAYDESNGKSAFIPWTSFSKVQQERIMTAAHCDPLSYEEQNKLDYVFKDYLASSFGRDKDDDF